MRRAVLPILLVLASSCASQAENTDAEATTSPESHATVLGGQERSIPWCPPLPNERWVAPPSSPESLDRSADVSIIIQRISQEFANDQRWIAAYFDQPSDTIVVRLTESSNALSDAVRAAAGESVEFEFGRYDLEVQRAAHDALEQAVRSDQSGPIGGYTGPGGLDDFIRISLRDLNAADAIAERYQLPAPLDVYCFEPDEDDTVNAPIG